MRRSVLVDMNRFLAGTLLFVFSLLFLVGSLTLPSVYEVSATQAQSVSPDYLCKPPWIVGDKATYFAIMHIGQAGGITFDYMRVEVLVQKGNVRWSEELKYLSPDVNLVRRIQLSPAPTRRSSGAFTNLKVPPRPYEHGDYIDVFKDDNVWAATVAGGAGQSDVSNLTSARPVSNMATYDLLWPITPMRRVRQILDYRDLTVEVRTDLVDLGHPLGKLPTILVADKHSWRGGIYVRKAWYSPRFPVAVKREWQWPSSDLRLELIGFEAGPETTRRESSCRAPMEMNLPGIGSVIVRAGLARGQPVRPPDGSIERFSPDDAVHGYVVFEPEHTPAGSTSPHARWIREDQVVHEWSPGSRQLEPRWAWFWWVSSLPREKRQSGSYVLEWLVDGTVVAKVPFIVEP